MSNLRPECEDGTRPATADAIVLRRIYDAVTRRSGLIHGRLNDNRNRHCAMGAFWADHPTCTVSSSLVDAVAAINDSVPPTSTPKERLRVVRRWLRWKLKSLGLL